MCLSMHVRLPPPPLSLSFFFFLEGTNEKRRRDEFAWLLHLPPPHSCFDLALILRAFAFFLFPGAHSVCVRRCDTELSLDEKQQFLEEAEMLKDLGQAHNPNIANIVGCCLQDEPFIILIEQASLGLVSLPACWLRVCLCLCLSMLCACERLVSCLILTCLPCCCCCCCCCHCCHCCHCCCCVPPSSMLH